MAVVEDRVADVMEEASHPPGGGGGEKPQDPRPSGPPLAGSALTCHIFGPNYSTPVLGDDTVPNLL